MEEHVEQEQFFIRLEIKDGEKEILEQEFATIAQELKMEFSFFNDNEKVRIALFCSDTLHCPFEVLMQSVSNAIPIEIVCIISNANNFQPIAEKFKIPFFFTSTQKGNFSHEIEHLKILKNFKIDLIALGRYMKIISEDFLQKVETPVINIHHSFLPSFIGGKPYEMAFERGVKLIGATSHFVTKDLDEGPIIAQDVTHIQHNHNIETMKSMGATIEKTVFITALKKFAEHKIIEFNGRTVVFQ